QDQPSRLLSLIARTAERRLIAPAAFAATPRVSSQGPRTGSVPQNDLLFHGLRVTARASLGMNLARLIEQGRDLVGGCAQVEMLHRGLARRVAHARASLPVAEQRREGAGQRRHV